MRRTLGPTTTASLFWHETAQLSQPAKRSTQRRDADKLPENDTGKLA
ncbi:hypothetical protein G3I59_09485 [Amycolatopsis rubida]|uniref:Uncharacterized protein n=1 Tax=Amycolatopsis rubida TaxID=112413 RepID=A0ABX0BKK7_9PSEU|nr:MULTISPECIES: hypothetical protein [Amycolatopsis]MYW90833.1 hypothetical protein [Amycolatopsis rubida]NEC55816.1 hypothetical protein [Amycolatopsis rubida]